MKSNDKLLNFFQRALDVNHAVYGLGIDVLAAYSPLLATVIPAWLTYHNTFTYLGFPRWVSITTAAVVEVLGLAAVHTTISLREYNNGLTRKSDQRSPLDVALGASIAYIVIILVVNVGLDLFAAKASWIEVVAKGFLAMLSIIGALIVAVRAQHNLKLTGNDPVTVQQLNDKLQAANERNRRLDETNRQVNDEKRELNNRNEALNKENGVLNAELIRVNGWLTLFDESVDAAERIHRAAVLLPERSQSFYAQLLNISKSYVSDVFSRNGFHRTPAEQE